MGSTSISYQLPLTEKLHKETIDGRGSNCGSHVSKATVKDLAFKKWANSGLFLFIFVLFKQHDSGKKLYLGLSGIQNRIVGIEDDHADNNLGRPPTTALVFHPVNKK